MKPTTMYGRRTAIVLVLLWCVASSFMPSSLRQPLRNSGSSRILRMADNKDDEESTPRKKTPRELVELAYQLEKEEGKDFFSGVRNFFGSIFPGNRREEKIEDPPTEDSGAAESSSSVEQNPTPEISEGAAEPDMPAEESAAVEATEPEVVPPEVAPVEATTMEPSESKPKTADLVASQPAETVDPAHPETVETAETDDPAHPETVETAETFEPKAEIVESAQAVETTDKVEIESSDTDPSSTNEAEPEEDDDEGLSEEDFLATIEVAQGRLSEGKIAGLDDFLATTKAEATPPPVEQKPPTRPKVDMETVAEMARRAVEEYERSIAEDEQESLSEAEEKPPAEAEEKPLAFVRGSQQPADTLKQDPVPVVASVEDPPIKEESKSNEGIKVPKPAFVTNLDDTPTVDWSALTVTQLKNELESRNLKKSGRKADLIARLEAAATSPTEELVVETGASVVEPVAVDVAKHDGGDSGTDWALMTVKELRNELKTRNLPTSGKKVNLIALLEESEASSEVDDPESSTTASKDSLTSSEDSGEESNDSPVVLSDDSPEPGDDTSRDSGPDYSAMTLSQLKTELKDRGMPVSGKKSVLIDRLSETIKSSERRTLRQPIGGPDKLTATMVNGYDADESDHSSMQSPTLVDFKESGRELAPKALQLDIDLVEPNGLNSKDSNGAKKETTLREELSWEGHVADAENSSGADEEFHVGDFKSIANEQADKKPRKPQPKMQDEMVDLSSDKSMLPELANKARQTIFDRATESLDKKQEHDLLESIAGMDRDDFPRLLDELAKKPRNAASPKAGSSKVATAVTDDDYEEPVDAFDLDDFAMDSSILNEMAEEARNAASPKAGSSKVATAVTDDDYEESVDAFDLDDFAMDSSILNDMAKEARNATMPMAGNSKLTAAVTNEDYEEPVDGFDLDSFAMDSSILNEMAEEARNAAMPTAGNSTLTTVVTDGDDEELDLDDFAMDSSRLNDLAEEARKATLPKAGSSKSTIDATDEEPVDGFDLDDFAIDSSMLDELAEIARNDALSEVGSSKSMADAIDDIEADIFGDDSSLEDFTFEGESLDSLAELARQTVDRGSAVSSSTGKDADDLFSIRDWSKVPLAELRSELEARGLPSTGAKMSLVAALEVSDLQRLDETDGVADTESDEDALLKHFSLGDLGMDEMSKAARDAAAMFEDDDEPSDEALRAIENELKSEFSSSNRKSDPKPLDYESMAVSHLKRELKTRGLRVTGKKIDLIARLQESDKS